VSAATQFYITSVAIVACIDIIAAWGFDLQFGTTGINNFAFIIFVAAGAYTAAILSLGPSSSMGGFQSYVGGSRLPFPLPIIGGALVAGLLALAVGAIVLRRLRGSYEAIVLLILSLIATGVAEAQIGLVNGPAGLALIPKPFASTLGLPCVVCLAGRSGLPLRAAPGSLTLRPEPAGGARERGGGGGHGA
jgi:branched-chain amino acid transport system permease protein